MIKQLFNFSKQIGKIEYIYGLNPCQIAINSGKRQIHEIIVLDSFQYDMKPKISNIINTAIQQKVEIKYMPRKYFEKQIKNQPHQGIMIKTEKLPMYRIESQDQLLKQEKKQGLFYLFLDQITDPQNFGAIIRNALFLGCDGIIVNEKATCPLNPTVSKTSSGAMELMEINSVKQPKEFLMECQNMEWKIFLTGKFNKKQNINLNDLKIEKNDNIIVILGSEGDGISEYVSKQFDQSIFIDDQNLKFPYNLVDSLNVSVTSGLIINKIRQR